jgi:hypothetical protein
MPPGRYTVDLTIDETAAGQYSFVEVENVSDGIPISRA